ncbi:MAG: hypothetical protein ACRD0D_03705 [Acidimicrobiales bacterium]
MIEVTEIIDNVLSEYRAWDGLGPDDVLVRCTGSWAQLAARVSGDCSHGPNWHLVDQRYDGGPWEIIGWTRPPCYECEWAMSDCVDLGRIAGVAEVGAVDAVRALRAQVKVRFSRDIARRT